ncbi:hypothetical protein ASA1KI_43540 [Opitutales bacterium ASA1]|uniref:hypothetical protein n=1 Tax=Congregicoccus parvus TaxID=3081749 RepID=UPI002B292E56|nr:hypothetical protein ASA1KI_43540 [Opitutales bacterium ASA1]
MSRERIAGLVHLWFVVVFAAELAVGIAVGKLYFDLLAFVLVAVGLLSHRGWKVTVASWALAFYMIATGVAVFVFWTDAGVIVDAATISSTTKTIIGLVLHALLLGHAALLYVFFRARW